MPTDNCVDIENVVIYITEWYSGVNKNEIIKLTGKWMVLEIIIVSEVSQTQKDKYHIFPQQRSFICQ